MIESKDYEKILEDLADEIRGTSDLLSVQAHPYDAFVTSEGKMDNRKKFFSIKFTMLTYNVSAYRFTQIMVDVFQRINNWIGKQDNVYFFINDVRSVSSGDNPRLEIEIKFDNMIDISKRLLIKG